MEITAIILAGGLSSRMGTDKGIIQLDEKKLGFSVTVLLGIHLKNAKDVEVVIQLLDNIKEVVEAYYTTGSYALIVKNGAMA